MAKCVVTQEAPPPPKIVTLTLTMEEAQAIRSLTGNVIGEGEFRKVTERVFHALTSAQVEHYPNLELPHGGMRFRMKQLCHYG